ncbi:MAG TPA: tetratricopeptide repeat protein [Burkholderiales bacterium]|nr:tetratricopeptide repeat protein [Burkholderiales bacterium]
MVVEGRMSVINKMLQDLDRRQALGAAAEPSVVRASIAKSGGHEWFWRILVVLLTAALAWMGWVAVQLLPGKPLVTELAYQAAAEAQTRAAAKPVAPAAAPAPTPVPEEKIVEAPPPAPESLRLALQLETPVQERAEKLEAPKPISLKPKPKPAPPPAAAVQAPAKAGTVDKRDRTRSAADNADAHFRRAALLLSHGRVSEAEGELQAALRADPSHTAARQAYVALLLEQQRVGVAHRLLQEALALNPEQPAFAVALARIYVGQRQHAPALEVLDRAGSATVHAEFQAMRGAVLQRLGRHAEAVEAYQTALRNGIQPATSWIGLGISLEGLGRRSEAVLAYRRALTAGPIAAEARDYAESRARALE